MHVCVVCIHMCMCGVCSVRICGVCIHVCVMVCVHMCTYVRVCVCGVCPPVSWPLPTPLTSRALS